MSNLPYEVQAFSTTTANTKVFVTYDGASSFLPPDADPLDTYLGPPSWPGYDDSSWPTPTEFGSPAAPSWIGAGYGPFAGPSHITPWATPPSPHAQFVWRFTFTSPDDEWAPFLLIPNYSPAGNETAQVFHGRSFLGFGWRFIATASAARPGVATVVYGVGGGGTTEGAGSSWWGVNGTNTAPFNAWIGCSIFYYRKAGVGGQKIYSWGTPSLGGSDKGVLGGGIDVAPKLEPTAVDMSSMVAINQFTPPTTTPCHTSSVTGTGLTGPFGFFFYGSAVGSNLLPGAAMPSNWSLIKFTVTADDPYGSVAPAVCLARVRVFRTSSANSNSGATAYEIFMPVFPGETRTEYRQVPPGMYSYSAGVSCLATTTVSASVEIYCEPELVIRPPIYKIASNGRTALMLSTEGFVYQCGSRVDGHMTAADSSNHLSPVLIEVSDIGLTADVSIGTDCSLVLNIQGVLWVSGPNASGSCGTGNTTAQPGPHESTSGAYGISAGYNHSALVGSSGIGVGQAIFTAGDNTYGQCGRGTTGGNFTTFAGTSGGSNGVPFTSPRVVEVSAGLYQTFVLLTGTLSGVDGHYEALGWGRAEWGSIGYQPYNNGTGGNHIINGPWLIGWFGQTPYDQAKQAGTVSFIHGTSLTAAVWGDGTPYGGAGDTVGTFIYGQASFLDGGSVGSPTPFRHIANVDGGSQNSWAVGDSRAVFAAYQKVDTVSGLDDGLLYTWGYGGYGQMGNGGTTTLTNATPVSVNGLIGVTGATIADGIIFAICTAAGAVRTRARSTVQWVD